MATTINTNDAGHEFDEGQDLLWASKDYDFPVKFLGMVEEKGSDGRVYARVEMEGKETFAPMDELKAVPPKNNTAEATFDPMPVGPEGLNIGGDKGDEISEEEKARRAAILAAELRALDEETAAEAEAEAQKKREAETEADRQRRDRTMLGNIYMRSFMHVQTGEDFFKVRAHQSIPGQNDRVLSDKQLKAVILSAALEKNWGTLYFYKGRSEIDPQLTARANAMIQKLQMPGQPLHGIELNASPRRMREVEPWNEGRWLYSAFRDMANKREEIGAAVNNSISSKWNGLVKGTLFSRTEEEGPGVIKRWTAGALSGAFTMAATGATALGVAAEKLIHAVVPEKEPEAAAEAVRKAGTTVGAGPGRAI